jgi:ADP-heptose:LPS heptosyltransferase
VKVLAIRHGSLGDVIQALGPFQAIRRHHRDAHLVALTGPAFADLLHASGWFQEVWVDERPPLWRLWPTLSLIARLRRAGFDRVYDLQTSSRTSLYFRLLGPNPPEWSGVAAGASLPHANPDRVAMHTLDRQAEQLRLAGIDAVPPPELGWLGADVSRFGLPERFVLMVPGGSRHRPAKRWPVERYAETARALAAEGLAAIVVGTADEAPLANAIGRIDLTGRTSLLELAGVARRASLAIGNDTGPMHVAAAVGCPSLTVFSSDSDPARCAPRGHAAAHLQRPDLADLPVADVVFAAQGLMTQGRGT